MMLLSFNTSNWVRVENNKKSVDLWISVWWGMLPSSNLSRLGGRQERGRPTIWKRDRAQVFVVLRCWKACKASKDLKAITLLEH